jgi:hypothetical protein
MEEDHLGYLVICNLSVRNFICVFNPFLSRMSFPCCLFVTHELHCVKCSLVQTLIMRQGKIMWKRTEMNDGEGEAPEETWGRYPFQTENTSHHEDTQETGLYRIISHSPPAAADVVSALPMTSTSAGWCPHSRPSLSTPPLPNRNHKQIIISS